MAYVPEVFEAVRQVASEIKVSIDLVAASRRELELLQAVDRFPGLYSGPLLTRATYRYEHFWLPLLNGAAEGRIETGNLRLVPPLDVQWVWHVHRLSPVKYRQDCLDVYGRLIDCHLASNEEAASGRTLTRKLWSECYPAEPYDPSLSDTDDEVAAPDSAIGSKLHGTSDAIAPSSLGGAVVDGDPLAERSAPRPRIKHDLAAAAGRQRDFYFQVSQVSKFDDRFLEGAVERYKWFLYLMWRAQGQMFCVPTYEIDIVWHAHQAYPSAYYLDTSAIFGSLKDHDDTVNDRVLGGKLDTGYFKTTAVWEALYGALYVKAGSFHRSYRPKPLPLPPGSGQLAIPIEPGPYQPEADVNADLGLTKRHLAQVCMVVGQAVNVDLKGLSPNDQLFVRAKSFRKCSGLTFETKWVAPASEVRWRSLWTLQVEMGSEGLILELWANRGGFLRKLRGSKLLGEVPLSWQQIMSSRGLAYDKFIPLLRSKAQMAPLECALALQVGASITPPLQGAYMFLQLPANARGGASVESAKAPSGREGKQESQWIARHVVDHQQRHKFSVRISSPVPASSAHGGVLTAARPVPHLRHIQILKVGQPETDNGSAPRMLEHVCQQTPSSDARVDWTSDYQEGASWRLGIMRKLSAAGTSSEVAIELADPSRGPARVEIGKKLQYESPGASPQEDEEGGFFTLVRYSPLSPQGKATALFNWRTGAMEVAPEESVLLLLALSTAIASTMADWTAGTAPGPRQIQGPVAMPPPGEEWGSMVIERRNVQGDSSHLPFGSWFNYKKLMWNSFVLS